MTVTVRGTSHWHSLVTDLVTVPPVTVTRTVSAAAAATVTRAGRTVTSLSRRGSQPALAAATARRRARQ